MKINLAMAVLSLCFCVSLTANAQQIPTSNTPLPQSPEPEIVNYLLGPGDLLEVKVFGVSELGSLARIDGYGNLRSLPFLEKPIPAKCRDEVQLQNAIAEAYKKLINRSPGDCANH